MNQQKVKRLRKAFRSGYKYLKENNKLPVLPFYLNNKISHMKYFWRKYKQAYLHKQLEV